MLAPVCRSLCVKVAAQELRWMVPGGPAHQLRADLTKHYAAWCAAERNLWRTGSIYCRRVLRVSKLPVASFMGGNLGC